MTGGMSLIVVKSIAATGEGRGLVDQPTSTYKQTLRPSNVLSKVYRWCVQTEASTRSSAIVRILLVLVLWSRWGRELLMYRDVSLEGLAFTGSFFVFTSLMLFGIFAQLSGFAVAGLVASMVFYKGVYLGYEPWTHHHTYFLAYATILISFAPIGRSLSIDRWFALRREANGGRPAPPERANIWALRLLCLQLCTLYLWTAIDKSNAAFLDGTRMNGYLLEYYLIDHPGRWFDVLCLVLGVSTTVLEYALAFGLPFGVTRLWVMLPGILLHGVFYALLPVQTFSATVWVMYIACLDPDALDETFAHLMSTKPRGEVPASM